ncbi:Lrp/AsnC family transcriptional regulator [Dactylosporangium sp. CA-092794]|uniref:Lrp/AsnC family transcriptional regulator n=1 Tax=Dactylosporangium sp. CA-092794 TaxID=3239929 RepID=UPI003D93C160
MNGASVADSLSFEPDDLRIIRVLQVDPRTPFSTMATVLGLSEPTVSRRYARLRRAGMLRVTGVVDPGALGQSQCVVRIRCRPGGAAPMAEALAHRDDVSWVALTAAGSEVTLAIRSRSPEERDDLLGHRLPRAAAVLDLDVSVLLRKFLGGRGRYWAALTAVLTPEQEAQLGPAGGPVAEEPIVVSRSPQLEPHDEKLLSALATDGRASLVDLATAAGLTPGRASRRLQTLLSHRVLSIHLELAPAALGYHTRATLWLRVRPSRIKPVGRALARMPEVGFAAALSGRNNLQAEVHCRDLDELFEFTTGRVGTLPGVESVEVGLIHRQIKQAGTFMDGDRLL